MPFDSSGNFSYTNPAAATGAVPGDVIRSANWNQIDTDIQNALTMLAKGQVTVPPVVQGAGSFAVGASDAAILVTANAPTITLPASSTKTGTVRIYGAAAGIFSVHNSNINPNGAQTISGLTVVTLAQDYQVIALYPLATGGYIAY